MGKLFKKSKIPEIDSDDLVTLLSLDCGHKEYLFEQKSGIVEKMTSPFDVDKCVYGCKNVKVESVEFIHSYMDIADQLKKK